MVDPLWGWSCNPGRIWCGLILPYVGVWGMGGPILPYTAHRGYQHRVRWMGYLQPYWEEYRVYLVYWMWSTGCGCDLTPIGPWLSLKVCIYVHKIFLLYKPSMIIMMSKVIRFPLHSLLTVVISLRGNRLHSSITSPGVHWEWSDLTHHHPILSLKVCTIKRSYVRKYKPSMIIMGQ